jgi:hypothetical protein
MTRIGRLADPYFFQIGGEAAAGTYLVNDLAMSNYAATHEALQVAPEHRFYGASQPPPRPSQPLSNFSTANLQFLTIEQALADATGQVPIVAGKVVAFGGSYPGNLDAWMRIKFPSVIDMAVASSAPRARG